MISPMMRRLHSNAPRSSVSTTSAPPFDPVEIPTWRALRSEANRERLARAAAQRDARFWRAVAFVAIATCGFLAAVLVMWS